MWLRLVLIFIAAAGVCEAAEFPVTRFGAVADDEAPDTAAIQAAIDARGQAGGGRVLFPPGTCLSGTLRRRSGVELHLRLIGPARRLSFSK
jgi:polygalacturonase